MQRFCDEAIYLQSGRVAARGDPDEVIAKYLDSVVNVTKGIPAPDAKDVRGGDGRVRVLRGWLEDGTGKHIGRTRSGDQPTIVVLFEVNEDTERPVIGIAVAAEDSSTVYSINTEWLGQRTQFVRAGQIIEMRVPIVAALPNGRYKIRAGALDENMTVFHDLLDDVVRFVVHGSLCRHGVADLQGRITYRLLAAVEDAVATDEAETTQPKEACSE